MLGFIDGNCKVVNYAEENLQLSCQLVVFLMPLQNCGEIELNELIPDLV